MVNLQQVTSSQLAAQPPVLQEIFHPGTLSPVHRALLATHRHIEQVQVYIKYICQKKGRGAFVIDSFVMTNVVLQELFSCFCPGAFWFLLQEYRSRSSWSFVICTAQQDVVLSPLVQVSLLDGRASNLW